LGISRVSGVPLVRPLLPAPLIVSAALMPQ